MRKIKPKEIKITVTKETPIEIFKLIEKGEFFKAGRILIETAIIDMHALDKTGTKETKRIIKEGEKLEIFIKCLDVCYKSYLCHALRKAYKLGEIKRVKYLLKKGAEVDPKAPHKHIENRENKYKIIKLYYKYRKHLK